MSALKVIMLLLPGDRLGHVRTCTPRVNERGWMNIPPWLRKGRACAILSAQTKEATQSLEGWAPAPASLRNVDLNTETHAIHA